LVSVPEGQQAQMLQLLYPNGSGDENYPGLLCHNHFGPKAYGPKKADWMQPCGEDYPSCFSQQEAVFGTELLKRLENIKKAVDPDALFVVPGGVGYDPFDYPPPTTDSPTTEDTTDTSDATFLSTMSTAAIVLFLSMAV